jgi:glycine/D-amino acid oxidase-like deaminating enzyme
VSISLRHLSVGIQSGSAKLPIARRRLQRRQHGVDSRLMAPHEIASLVPELHGTWRRGLFTARDGHVDPVKATLAFADAARRLGVTIDEHTPAVGIDVTGNRATGVITPRQLHRGQTVLCAAGIGAAALTRTIGVSLPIQTVRACVAQTGAAPTTVKTAVWSPQVAFRPRRDGSFTIGNGYRATDAEYDLTPDSLRHLQYFLPTYLANWRIVKLHFGKPFFEAIRRTMAEHGIFQPLPEPGVNQKLVAYNKKQFDRLMPGFSGLGIARSWAGRIDATPDLIPIIGPLSALEGYYVAAGFNGHGLALGPVLGRLLGELIATGSTSLDLSAFRASRFAEEGIHRHRGAL